MLSFRPALRVLASVFAAAAPLLVVVACSSDDSTDGTSAKTDSGTTRTGDAASSVDGGDAGQAHEGQVTSLGTFGAVDLSGLTNALSEVSTVTQGTEQQVVLAQYASCNDITDGPSANAVFLELSLYTTAADGTRTAATGPGTYNVDLTTAGPFADAYVIAFDPTCHPEATSGKLEEGTVTVTSLSASNVAGTFHLMSVDGVITGSFSTIPCTGAYDLVAPASTASCH